MSTILGKPIEQVVDGENNAVEFDFAYSLKGDPRVALGQLRASHGDDILLLPMSATSAGGGIFQNRDRPAASIIGLRFDAPLHPRLRFAAVADLTRIEQDEIVIDRELSQVCAGSAITLNQLNRALADELGHCYKVPGADLTSYMYAAVGATFMTGGMGPQRRYFSDSVVEAAIFDGEEIISVGGAALAGYAGTYGWSGMVCALRCRYYRFPANEIAFALPVSGVAPRLARLLAHLAPCAYLQLNPAGVTTQDGGDDLILGIEHVSCAAMQPLLQGASDHPCHARAMQLKQKCEAAGVDGLVFINGFSERSSDEFLLDLADDTEAETLSIAGMDIEFAEVFGDPEEMRAVREAVPYTARTQASGGRWVYKNHSDANIRMAAGAVAEGVEQLWRINCRYVEGVQRFFDSHAQIEGQILVYGHLNPYGVDPHNRVTMSADDEAAFGQCRDFLVEQRAHYYRELAELCASGNAEFIGGEKSADSEIAIYRALAGPRNAPAALYDRFRQQCRTIAAASPLFNWRALPPYRSA
jgi:hypothetical protein